MDKRQKIIVAVFALIFVAALVVLVVVASRRPDVIISEFKAPPFEENAILGVPEGVDKLENYREIDVNGNYKFALAGTPLLDGDKLLVHFSSHEDNNAWLLIRIYDMQGNKIGESGILRAGEYVEAVSLSGSCSADSVRVKILSYEPQTYYSLGTASATLPIIKISK